MKAIASPEFVALCRAQLRLLSDQLATASAALYLADIAKEEPTGQSSFIPIASYPEPVERWVANFERATPWTRAGQSGRLALTDSTTSSSESPIPLPISDTLSDTAFADAPLNQTEDSADDESDPPKTGVDRENAQQAQSFSWPDVLRPEQQLVMPLLYSEVVVGLLVAVQCDHPWQSEERKHLEAVAQALAAGCVLERRNQWLQTQLTQKQGLQSRQSEIFHNLLHQFRNPLTAVSTFGQLLVRRLGNEDPNQPIADGIVRESKRLRELVTHFDEALAVGDAEFALPTGHTPPLLPASSSRLAAAQSPSNPASADSPPHSSETPEIWQTPASADGPSVPERVNSGGLGHQLTLSAQYLPDVLEPVLAVASIVAAENSIVLQGQVAADTPLVWGEAEALGEVVSNLVDNAIKYSGPGALVWVQTGVSRVGETGHYQGIIVGDTGPGIPQADFARLFERNYRGVQAQGDIPGTGLGLAIAHALVAEMQGFIEVVSPARGTPWMPNSWQGAAANLPTPPGQGTVFIVWLLEVQPQEIV